MLEPSTYFLNRPDLSNNKHRNYTDSVNAEAIGAIFLVNQGHFIE